MLSALEYYLRVFMENEKSKVVTSLEYSDSIDRSQFSKDDIRRQTKLFWYAFEGGKFSPNHDAYPNCQGVVGWINPYPTARDGCKVYVVLPEQKQVPYASKHCYVGAISSDSGRGNTRKLIEYGKEYGVKFSAAEYAYNYTKNGVKEGEAFLPAQEQLKNVIYNCAGIRKALRLIGGTFEGWLWSSSEEGTGYAWTVDSIGGDVVEGYKSNALSVSCFLAY